MDRSRNVSGDSCRTTTPDFRDPDETAPDIEDSDHEDESRLDEPWQTDYDAASIEDHVAGTRQLKASWKVGLVNNKKTYILEKERDRNVRFLNVNLGQ